VLFNGLALTAYVAHKTNCTKSSDRQTLMMTTEHSETQLSGDRGSPNGYDHGFDFGNITTTPQRNALSSERERERGPGPASPPPQSIDTRPRSSTSKNMAVNGVADFFSPEVFQIVLHNPATAHQLLKFSQARLSGENMEFLERVSARKFFTTVDARR
jgi:hypothetical protein